MDICRFQKSDFISALSVVSQCVDKTETYKRQCSDRVAECDKILVDLDHKLELEPMDAIAMTKTINYRKRILQERRQVKDEIDLTDSIISSCKDTQFLHNQMIDIQKSFSLADERLKNRQYTPRIAYDIFNNNSEDKKTRDNIRKKIICTDAKGRLRKPSQHDIHMEELFQQIKK